MSIGLKLCLTFIYISGCGSRDIPPGANAYFPEFNSSLMHPTLLVEEGKWLEVDSRDRVVRVCDQDKIFAEFSGAAFGSSGVKIKSGAGDNVTPVGNFKIGWITKDSKFLIFIGLAYPSKEYAERGFETGTIDKSQLERIIGALDNGLLPPQDTRLGGKIGIHGLGSGSPLTHSLVNWTNGCIALTNSQIKELANMVQIGMRVVVGGKGENHLPCSRFDLVPRLIDLKHFQALPR